MVLLQSDHNKAIRLVHHLFDGYEVSSELQCHPPSTKEMQLTSTVVHPQVQNNV
jgi:hypothetical protein